MKYSCHEHLFDRSVPRSCSEATKAEVLLATEGEGSS